MSSEWKTALTEDERTALEELIVERDLAMEELLDAKRNFDRKCDDLYLLCRTVRERYDATNAR